MPWTLALFPHPRPQEEKEREGSGLFLASSSLLAQSWEAAAERGRYWEGPGQTRKEAFQENWVLNSASTPSPSSLRALEGKLGGELPCPMLHALCARPDFSSEPGREPMHLPELFSH